MLRFRNQLGQSMFELLAAVAVVAVALIALISLSTQAVGDTTSSRSRTQATRYSQEALEWVREQRDLDWNDFYDYTGGVKTTYCLQTLAVTEFDISGSCDQVNDRLTDTIFWREVTLDPTSADVVEVDVLTRWEDGSGIHSSRAATVLTNWKSL